MAVPVITVASVNAPDAAPSVAPHKLSNADPSKDQVEIRFGVTFNGANIWRTKTTIGGTSRLNGKLNLDWSGVVCGMDRLGFSGTRRMGGGQPTLFAGNFIDIVEASGLTDGEGNYDVWLDMLNDDGWNVRS